MKSVELVTIGDELLLGFTIDTNSAYLAQRLAEHGIAISRRTTVGDEMDTIVEAVETALDRTGAVITTGGLGPTSDDLSRDAVAKVFGRAMQLDEEHLAWMEHRWRTRFNRELPQSNRRQAMLPAKSRKLENKHGSAPGTFIDDKRGWVIMLPGVPREMRGMTEDTLMPLLRELGMVQDARIRSVTLRTTGVAESLLQDLLTPAVSNILRDAKDVLSLAYLPGVDGVDLRATARASNAKDADAAIDRIVTAIRGAVADSIYGEGNADLAEIVLDLCRAKKLKVVVAESCTGGLLGSRLTAIPGSSDVFVGGVIAYANEVKTRELGVTEATLRAHGAVSEETVRQMALGARQKFGADLALAITGVAGPTGGPPEKPVGLVWICAAYGDKVEPRKIQSWGDRNEVRYRAAQAALELARRLLS